MVAEYNLRSVMSKVQIKFSSDTDVFNSKLKAYRESIDKDIAEYGKHIQAVTLQQYGVNARLETDVFLDILGRGGKRIRGALVMLGYEMSGGAFDFGAGTSHLDAGVVFSASTGGSSTNSTVSEARRGKTAASAKSISRIGGSADKQVDAVRSTRMILQAARAIEMLHAYILIIDDIQDRSLIRRGGPAAHIMLRDYHQKHQLAGDSEHFGVSIALNAALAGAHAAQMILANMDVPEQLRLSVLSIVNRTMVITAHGQTSDIMNEVAANIGMVDVERVMAWKTAQYSFLNPLHVGMVLAGADCHATDAITDYATFAGKAFQITDDILGIYGSEQATGKSPMDDIKEGKRTILTVYALENSQPADKNFLIQILGNPNLTPAEFERCQEILAECGSLKHAKSIAKKYVEQAVSSLDSETHRWTPEGTQFLRGLAQYILSRTA